MDQPLIDNILFGLTYAVTWQNMFFCSVGVIVGTAVGVLPGIGSATSLALILPFISFLPYPSSVIMMMAIYYGCQYGGSTTAILTKVAGEVSSIPTIIEGNLLAKKGYAGPALSIAAIGSFVAGILSAILIIASSNWLANLFLWFGPAEYIGLAMLSMLASVILSDSKNLTTGFGSLLVGILFGLIGFDISTGEKRFTFNQLMLYDGIGIAIFSLGLFGICETFKPWSKPQIITSNLKILPSYAMLKQSFLPIIRGTSIGSLVGLLPGSGFLSSFISFFIEKKLDNGKNFGNGAIAGVAGPESANNASSQISLVPVVIFGIPVNTSTALILSALVLSGSVPGVKFITDQNSVFWIVVASMFVGNSLLIILNMPLIKIWIQLLKISPKYLNFLVLSLCCLGAYSMNESYFEVICMLVIGLFAFLLYMSHVDCVPAITGFVLGPIVEDNIRRAASINNGNYTWLISSNINLICVAIAVTLIFAALKKPVSHRLEGY